MIFINNVFAYHLEGHDRLSINSNGKDYEISALYVVTDESNNISEIVAQALFPSITEDVGYDLKLFDKDYQLDLFVKARRDDSFYVWV